MPSLELLQLDLRYAGLHRAVRRLHALCLDYPTDLLRGVLADAVEHRAYDLGQVERVVLHHAGADVFRIAPRKDKP